MPNGGDLLRIALFGSSIHFLFLNPISLFSCVRCIFTSKTVIIPLSWEVTKKWGFFFKVVNNSDILIGIIFAFCAKVLGVRSRTLWPWLGLVTMGLGHDRPPPPLGPRDLDLAEGPPLAPPLPQGGWWAA